MTAELGTSDFLARYKSIQGRAVYISEALFLS